MQTNKTYCYTTFVDAKFWIHIQIPLDNIQHVATCIVMYEQGDQTTFSTQQMLHVVS